MLSWMVDVHNNHFVQFNYLCINFATVYIIGPVKVSLRRYYVSGNYKKVTPEQLGI